MKRLNLFVVSLLSFAAMSVSSVAAEPYWKLDMNKPAAVQNKRSFNVQYTVLSTEEDTFTVDLYQNGQKIQSQQTGQDPDAVNGNSGAFLLSGVADGQYSYFVSASRNNSDDSPQTTTPQSVRVDATPTAAPNYLGKTRTGNSYTISFTAPTDADVKEVRVFSATTTTFTAGPATLVGVVNVTPGQTTSLTYTAASDNERFHAVQAFDTAGNGSALTGDPNVDATPIVVQTAAAAVNPGAADVAGGAGAPAGQVQGAATNGGQVTPEAATTAGDVLGAATRDNANKSSDAVRNIALASLVIAIILGGLYYQYFYKTGRSLFKRG